ncbi:TIGR03618 family F420-dependent PPOX class oxidoreductase [Rhodococcus sp. G-MC3]|uniref:TIGR03618 family F420-dependent PPOX class oxidoreductase n=1 Tax=Rhodococcus sp. G-MC3 TaxID=3046209 RepID=UPI0024BA268B|nr:TIGR03618 family F420-dependent PPOX class oxidoreductase [Rhodococcus sp. G-MC3]MDJ0392522.1 TIGR03618 family F420-dependent PPOX class oxidoreductase [Rhodococcus sp. G-MC3]
MTTIEEAVALARSENGLAVVATLHAAGTIQASVVNVGLLQHPDSDAQVLGFVTYGKAKLANLRARPQVTVTFRDGWQWATVEGIAEIVEQTGETLRQLRRDVFAAAGGAHDDWDEYDRVMEEQKRSVVLIRIERVYSNR